MAYLNNGTSLGGLYPQTHPTAIYSLFYQFNFNTTACTDCSNWVYTMGDPNGYGLHGDFINEWTNETALQQAPETCTYCSRSFGATSCVDGVRRNNADSAAIFRLERARRKLCGLASLLRGECWFDWSYSSLTRKQSHYWDSH